MQYKNIDQKPNYIPWDERDRLLFPNMEYDFAKMINQSWNAPYGIRVLGSALAYIEDMPQSVSVSKLNYVKRYFKCRDISGKSIGIRLDIDGNGIPTVEVSCDNVSKTYQCLCYYKKKETFIRLASCSYKEGEMDISRFLFPNRFWAFLNKNVEQLEISIEDSYNNDGSHLILHDEDTIFKHIGNLGSLYDITSVCDILYHNNGQKILNNVIELGNYDELDDEENPESITKRFRAKIQNCELIHYQERILIRPNCFVTFIAELVDGEYQYDHKTLGFTDEGETAVKEEIEAYMTEMKLQVREISENLVKVLR